MGQQHKRRRLWINPPLQGRLLARVAVYLLLLVVFVWHVAFVFLALGSAVTGAWGVGLGGLYGQALGQQKYLLLALALTVPIVFYDLLRFSNRIAGPLYRCRAVMQRMAAGQPVAEFTPRKGDQLGEFFETFNELIRVWNAKLAADRGAAGGAVADGRRESA